MRTRQAAVLRQVGVQDHGPEAFRGPAAASMDVPRRLLPAREMRDLPGYIGVESMWGMFQLSTTTVIRRNFGGTSPSNTHSASYVPKL